MVPSWLGFCEPRGTLQPRQSAPTCTLLVRSIFGEAASGDENMRSATPEELAVAIIEAIQTGARMLNLSVALAQSIKAEREFPLPLSDLAFESEAASDSAMTQIGEYSWPRSSIGYNWRITPGMYVHA